MEQMRAQAEHVGTRIDLRHRRRGRPLAPAVPPHARRRRRMDLRRAHHRDRRAGALAGPPLRGALQGLWRLRLRHLRRLLLQGQGRARRRRRQHRGRGGALPVAPRREGDRRPPARRVPRRAHPAGAAVRARRTSRSIWDTALDEVLGKSGFPPAVTGARLRNVKTGADVRDRGRRHLHRHRPCAGRRAVQGPARA